MSSLPPTSFLLSSLLKIFRFLATLISRSQCTIACESQYVLCERGRFKKCHFKTM